MKKIKLGFLQIVGAIGALVCVAFFIREPSFPTPDKLIIFLTFIFMVFKQALEMLKRLGPFVIILLVYESFRSIADQLNHHVDYLTAPTVDKWMFGGHLPTASLQNWLWHGHVQWYDFALYFPYLLFFVLPLAVAIAVWKKHDHFYWRYIWTFLVVAFMAFFTFLLFPAAPPWLASDNHLIEPIVRISSHVWASLGLHDFPSVYNEISPNAVAAVPSLHAAWATLLSIFCFKIFGRKWGVLSLLYPAVVMFDVVYQGEHYVFDIILGALYAALGYYSAPHIMNFAKRIWLKLKSSNSTKNV